MLKMPKKAKAKKQDPPDSIRIPPDLKAAALKRAAAGDRSFNYIVIKALQEYLNHNKNL